MRMHTRLLTVWMAAAAAAMGADDGLQPAIDPCAESPEPCSALCREAVSAESRAVSLEAAAAESRKVADAAAKQAEFYEDTTTQKTGAANRQGKKRSWMGGPGALAMRTADVFLRFLVPRHARHNYPPKHTSGNADEKNEDLSEAGRMAEEESAATAKAKNEAYQAAVAAVAARTSADAARRSYEDCLCR